VLLEQIGKRWDHADIGWAVTGVMGASMLAPYLTETTTGDVYVDAASLPELHNIARFGNDHGLLPRLDH